MKTKLLTVLLCFLCIPIFVHVAAQSTTSSSNGGKSTNYIEKRNQPTKELQEQRVFLIKEYGLSMSQVLKVEALLEKKKAQVNAIKNSSLSLVAKEQRVKSVVAAHNQALQSIFTPAQYVKYEADVVMKEQRDAQMKVIRESYKDEYSRLRKKGLTKDQMDLAVENLRQRSISRLTTLSNVDFAKNEIRKIDIRRISNCDEIKNLKLSKDLRLVLGELKYNYEEEIIRLKKLNLPSKDRKERKKIIIKEYQAKVKKVLGDAKFNEWIAFRNQSHERQYKKKFNFTKEQYKKYKDIENKYAIDLMKIKKSNLSVESRKAKMDEAMLKKVEGVRKIISPAQFEKWYSAFSASEASKNSIKRNKL